MSQWWSWTLAAIGVAGLFLAGSNRKAGWAIGFGVQALWIAYAVAPRQWGFIASAIAYGAVYARNWWRWRSKDAVRPTYGVGERAPAVRQGAADRLAHLGVAVDEDRNAAADPETADRDVTAAGSSVRVLVVRAREDLEIAAGVEQVLGPS